MTLDISIRHALAGHIDAGDLAGAAVLVWRGSKTTVVTAGMRDLVTKQPVERNSIFRIASMTKAVTTVAALTLFDKRRFGLDDPITRCAPEFARMRVLRNPEGPLDDTQDAAREI